jgi:hypothetical protein
MAGWPDAPTAANASGGMLGMAWLPRSATHAIISAVWP